jgi:hypothetical protein
MHARKRIGDHPGSGLVAFLLESAHLLDFPHSAGISPKAFSRSGEDMANSTRFPMECPACHATSGMPYQVSTTLADDVLIVSLRCIGCGEQWSHEIPSVKDVMRGVLSNTGVSIDSPTE